MQVRILPFGVLKDWLGSPAATLELPEGATVADLLASLSERRSAPELRGIAVSINAVYATANGVLHEGDEVGLLPPVSGGSGSPPPGNSGEIEDDSSILTALTRNPIEVQKLVAVSRQGEDGAVVIFEGIVRNNSRGRKTLHLDYEAYEEMADRQMFELARQARANFGVRSVILIHRLGRLQVGETSVLIVVASAHRAQAFDACRWLIDTLKKTVPIWKKETFVDGTVWAPGEPLPPVLAADAPEASHGS